VERGFQSIFTHLVAMTFSLCTDINRIMNPMNSDLLKALTGAGIGSRRMIANAILRGKVTVNGIVAENLRHPVNMDKDRITVDGKAISLKSEKAVYLLLNKPTGIISTTDDEQGRYTVLDILPEKYHNLRLYPVGRLDKDSTGLLLLTNDGELTYRLTHPKFEQQKEYLVQTEAKLNPDDRKKLEQGVELTDGTTSPCKIKRMVNLPPFTYSLTIHEGKKRQVRRMFATLGYQVTALKRIRMGNLRLGDLVEGQVRLLSGSEVAQLKGKRKSSH
jgi:23S rRNA pseudouridine2605 synthase